MNAGMADTEGTDAGLDSLQPQYRSIKKLNLMYLSLLREVAQKDIKEAVVRFGVEASIAERIADMDIDQIVDHADSSVLQFRMRAPIAMRQLLRPDCDEFKRMAAHASIIADTKA